MNQSTDFPPGHLLPYIPYLRRYACLLCGSKEIGDEHVRLCLELIKHRPERLQGLDLRTRLFAAFHVVWTDRDAAEDMPEGEGLLERNLALLASRERQVLLLALIEEFSLEDIARILTLDVEAVSASLASARRQLCSRVPVLIIEDEPIIALELTRLVDEMGMVVTRQVGREDDAVVSAKHDHPGLILADIRLHHDGSGIAAAQEILERYGVPIVFVTGFAKRLLTDEGLDPAFVVEKPFQPGSLKATIAHALSVYATPNSAAEHRTKLMAKLEHVNAKEVQSLAIRATML